jgi:hypothetical protein
MSRVPVVFATIALCLACTERSIAPTALVAGPVSLANVSNGIVHRASGGGQLDVSIFNIPNEQYGFTALLDAAGNAKGQVHANFSDPDVTFHAEVDCLAVQGNAAWIGAVVTSENSEFPVGTHFAFKVIDNGEGAQDPPDEMSYWFFTPPRTCNFFFFQPGTFQWAHGNIQVR